LGTSHGDAYVEGAELGHADWSSQVHATVSQFAPIDFLTMDEQAAELGFTINTDGTSSPESRYMGFAIQSNPDEVARANPTTYLDTNDAAFLVQAGSADPLIPYTQSENFSQALLAELGPERVSFDLFEGAGHGGGAFNSDENLARIIGFFERHLGP
ncbi:MAG: prolyl oligopeptidase family serine peptidase, partial [Myxococcota bacterium]